MTYIQRQTYSMTLIPYLYIGHSSTPPPTLSLHKHGFPKPSLRTARDGKTRMDATIRQTLFRKQPEQGKPAFSYIPLHSIILNIS